MRSEKDLVVSVQSLCFTQETICVTFKRPRHQERIDDAVDLINDGYLSPKAFPNMNVIEFQGRLWSLDNRRLWVFKKAGVPSISVTLVACNFNDNFQSLRTTSPKLYAKLSTPGFFPRPRGYCKEIFTEVHPGPAELPSSFSPPPTPHARGRRRQVEVEIPTRMSKQSIPSAAPPYVREPVRPPKRRKSPPPFNVAKVSGTKSKHSLHYDDYYHAPPDFRNQKYDTRNHDAYQFRRQHPDLQQQTRRMRSSVVPPPPPGKYSPDGPPFLNTKRCHHGTERDRHHSPRTRQEACFSRPSKKQRAPSQVSEFKASSPDPSRTPFQESSSHPARKLTRNPARVRETYKASSPPLTRRLHQESAWPPYHTRGLNPLIPKPPVPKPPVPTPRERKRAAPRVRPAKEARPPSPARTRSSEKRPADRLRNAPSIRTPERKVHDSNGQQPSRRNPLDRHQTARPSVSKDIYSHKRREAKSSTCGAAGASKPSPPPAPAPKRSRPTRATSNPKNFSYGFHTSRKRPRASQGLKKADASTPSTECLSTQLPDHVPDMSVPSPASLKIQHASPEKPLEPLTSTSTNDNLSTATKERQIMDDNFTSDVIDPNENQGQHELVSGMMSPTTKTRQEQEQEQEQEAREIVDFAGKGEFLSDTEHNLFKLDVKQPTPADPELPPPMKMDPKDQQVLNEILHQLHKREMIAALQTVYTKPTEDTLQKEPSVQAESIIELPFQTRLIDVHQAAAYKAVTVTAGLEPAKVQATTRVKDVLEPQTEAKADSAIDRQQASAPIKDVLEPQTEAKAGSVIDHQQGQRAFSRHKGFFETAPTTNGEINPGLTKTAQANPIFANEVPEVSKRITRGQLKKEKEMERRKERVKRRALREAEKKKEREANSVNMKEKSVSSSQNLTTAIVPYDAARCKEMSKSLQTGDMAYVKVVGELTKIGAEGRSRPHPYLQFLGPFRVNRKYNAYTALLELPDDCCLKRTFSVKVLTKSRSPLDNCLPDKRLSITLVPEMVLNKRVARRLRKRKVIHYLVKWKTLPATEATWEPETIFDEHPHLLDQVDSPLFGNPYLLRNWKA